MSSSEKNELLKLIDANDCYGLMLLAVLLWVHAAHAAADYAAVYVHHRDETPPVRITVPSSVSSAPAAR